jgi:hypothetical protein
LFDKKSEKKKPKLSKTTKLRGKTKKREKKLAPQNAHKLQSP